MPEPSANTWPQFQHEALQSHAATFPSRADEYSSLMRKKLEAARRATPEEIEEAERTETRRRELSARLEEAVTQPSVTVDGVSLASADANAGATEAIDRLHTTAESHHRVLVVEVMGRHAGWIALHSGIAGGANVVLIPEQPFDIEAVCAHVVNRFKTQYSPIIVVSEGAVPADGGDMTLVSGEKDAFGHVRLGGIGDRLAREIEDRTGEEARAVVLGHIQRGGTPTAFDRWLATRFGLQAIDAVAEGDFGKMMALRGRHIVRVPLIEGTGELKLVTPEEYAEAQVFFG